MIETTEAEGGQAAISVFLAVDDLVVREGVRALLEPAPGLDAVGVAATSTRCRRAGTGAGA